MLAVVGFSLLCCLGHIDWDFSNLKEGKNSVSARFGSKNSGCAPQCVGTSFWAPDLPDPVSRAFKFDKSQSMCPRQQPKEKLTTASNEKASHGTKPLQGRARTTRKLQGNDVSRLCKQDQCEPITRLRRNASKSQLAAERERPVLAIQPQPVKRMALWL